MENQSFLLPVEQQLVMLDRYADWLKRNQTYSFYGEKLSEAMNDESEILAKFLGLRGILSFCHCGDLIATARLAVRYFSETCSNLKIWLADSLLFDRLRLNDCFLPASFNRFFLFEPYDNDGVLGGKFQGTTLGKAKEKAGDDWQGMSAELFQFLFITHRHYLYAMDGSSHPYLLAPGFLHSDKVVPYIGCHKNTVIIGCLKPDSASDNFSPVFSRYMTI